MTTVLYRIAFSTTLVQGAETVVFSGGSCYKASNRARPALNRAANMEKTVNLGALAHREHYQPIEQEARSMFLEDTNLSVDAVAKALSHKYRNSSISKDNISRIRQAVRQVIGRSTPAATPIKRRPLPREPFNPIKGITPPVEEKKPEPAPVEPTTSTHEERIHFLEDYALSHINATIDQARQALKKRFGQAVGTKAISDALAIVKRAAKESSKPEVPPAVEGCASMMDVVHFMRRNGLQQITALEGGSFKIVPIEE